MGNVTYQSALVCSKGCVRSNNEDNFCFLGDYAQLNEMDAGAHITASGRDACQAYAVFDGMGGGESGEQASFMAARLFAQTNLFTDAVPQEMELFVRKASQTVNDYAKRHHCSGQGTTFAGLLIRDEMAFVGNVGDSRVYLLRGKKLEMVSRDHSQVYNMYLNGQLTLEQARKHPRNNVITHYLGMAAEAIGEDYQYMDSFKLYYKDRFMLCSDGLCDLISNEKIEKMLLDNPTPDGAAAALVNMALELGGKDNVTCIVVDVLNRKLKNPYAAA